MYAAQIEAYKKVQTTTMSGREIEAAALMRCAIILSDCQENWGAPNNIENLYEALRINQRVWSILQAELIRDDNPLPLQLRKDILTLSVFIDKRSIEVMAYPVPEKLKILIDINKNLSAGLCGCPAPAD